ncbi:type II toxin-antitoxin system ParD family antitoxin [Azospirillum sp. sgz301742]
MPTRNINLTEHFDRFIEAGISAGRYQNASEVVRAALRLLEQQEVEYAEKRERFWAAIQEGIDADERGDVTILEEHEIADFIEKIGEEVEERARMRRTGT